MTHPFRNFYTCGVPRSGTTYFKDLINSHPQALCLMELMPPQLFERSWFCEEGLKSLVRYKSPDVVERALGQFQSKPTLQVFGDKSPRGIHVFPRVTEVMAESPVFVILREPAGVFASFNQRAANEKDSWPEWMNWLHAYLEVLVTIEMLASSSVDRVIIIEYRHLTGGDTRLNAAQRVFDALGLDVEPEVSAFLQNSQKATRSSEERKRSWSELEQSILSMPHMVAYTEWLQTLSFSACVSKRQEGARRVLDVIQNDLPSVKPILQSYLLGEGGAYANSLDSVYRHCLGKMPAVTNELVMFLALQPAINAKINNGARTT